MNGEVSERSVKEKAWEVCGDFLGGPWKEVAIEDLRIFELRGGFSNKIYRCALPEKTSVDCRIPKQALLRIYGTIQGDDPGKVVSEAVLFMLLAERKLGPKLYGMFPDGRLEEFIPSHILNSDELRQYSTLTAREMAKIHALDVPFSKAVDVFHAIFAKWLDELQEVLARDKGKYFMSLNEYRKEVEWLKQEMVKSNSPIVYCHNDLQGGNILYREDLAENKKPKLMFIDFEVGYYNYRGFDLANHFNEWCFDYNTPDFPHFKLDVDKFPTLEEQTEFFTAYVDQLITEGIQLKRPIREEIDSMIDEITLFICATHLLWSIWGAKMVLVTSTEKFYAILPNPEEALNDDTSNFNSNHPSKEESESGLIGAFKDYGNTRINLYWKCKERYLKVCASKNK